MTATLSDRLDELGKAFAPFLDIRHQKGSWGTSSKKLDGMQPMTLTVTKAQMIAAWHAHQSLPTIISALRSAGL